MTEWTYMVIIISALLLFFLVWKEVSRINKARLPWRLLATVLAVAGLSGMALPVMYHTANATVSNQAVLLTEGFSRDSVMRFLRDNNSPVPVLTTDINLKDAGMNAIHIPDAAFITHQYGNIHIFHVFGYGLEEEEINILKNNALIFHPAEIPAGITAISWPAILKAGDRLLVQGSINNPFSSAIKIVLKNFDATLDSVNVAGGKNVPLQLTTVPKHIGRAVYSLLVLAGKDTIDKEPVPVQVHQGDPLTVLMLSSSPDFERRFLQNYLSEHGFRVVVRTAISKNKYAKDFLNSPAQPLDRITVSVLEKFDVTIADAAELSLIAKPELAAIQTQVAQKGMGLIVRADSAEAYSAFYANRFPLTAATGNTEQQVNVFLTGTTNVMPALPASNPLFIRNRPGARPLVTDRQNRVFAGSTLYGSGKIILTTIANTYTWTLSGHQNEYATYWSELINKAVAKRTADEAWHITPALPQVNKPVTIQVETNTARMPHAQLAAASVYLKNNYDLPYLWSGTYYPFKAGWQIGIQLNGNPFYWYAYGDADWKNVYAAQRIASAKNRMAENIHTPKGNSTAMKSIQNEVLKIYFFLLFIIGSGFLWLESKKISGRRA